jgi:hypothetical protein
MVAVLSVLMCIYVNIYMDTYRAKKPLDNTVKASDATASVLVDEAIWIEKMILARIQVGTSDSISDNVTYYCWQLQESVAGANNV